jgi:hypothetical protein
MNDARLVIHSDPQRREAAICRPLDVDVPEISFFRQKVDVPFTGRLIHTAKASNPDRLLMTHVAQLQEIEKRLG